jgi:type 1 glutamine amidotransferase
MMTQRRCWLLLLAIAVLAGPAVGPAAAEKVKVLLVGGRGHDWKGFHQAIAPVLEKTGDFEVVLAEKLDELTPDNIKKYGLVLFYGSGGDFTDPKQERGLKEFVEGGGALAGVHATDAFKRSDVYWRFLGGRFTTHGGGKFWVRIDDKKHPITAPMADFEIHDETYQNQYHPEFKLHSLGRIDRGNEQQSMIWAQQVGKGRVFNTTLGHGKEAFDNPQFQRLVVRGLYWAAGRKPKDP